MRNNRLVKSTASLLLAVTVSFSSAMVASATETTSTNAAKTPQYAQSHYPSEAEIEAYLNDPQYKKYGRTREDVEAYLKANAEEDAATTTTMEAGLYSSWSTDLFSDGYWMNRSGVWSLSIMPRRALLWDTDRGWGQVYDRFHTSRHWTYYSAWADASMRKQFNCHAQYGMLKTPYNLEPSRSDVSPITCD